MSDSTQITPPAKPRFTPLDVIGFSVRAGDEPVGEVDQLTEEVGPDHLVVNAGGPLFNKKAMLPCWVVTHVDMTAGEVYVRTARETIKSAPPFDRDMRVTDPGYRAVIDTHYQSEPV